MESASPAFLAALRHCESEPIHIPASIQPDGALVVVSTANARVLQVSANLEQVLGMTPQAALGRPLVRLVGEGNFQRLRELPVRGDRQPPVPTTFQFDAQQGRPDLAVQVHRVDRNWVIELENLIEADQRQLNQLLVATRDALWESDLETDIVRYCQLITEQVREVTGFDRAMAYRFDPDWNGEVIACPRCWATTSRPPTSRHRPGVCTCATWSAPSPTSTRLRYRWCPRPTQRPAGTWTCRFRYCGACLPSM